VLTSQTQLVKGWDGHVVGGEDPELAALVAGLDDCAGAL
jgi:hypothetical protein